MDTTAGISWAGRARQTVGERERELLYFEYKTKNKQTNKLTNQTTIFETILFFLPHYLLFKFYPPHGVFCF